MTFTTPATASATIYTNTANLTFGVYQALSTKAGGEVVSSIKRRIGTGGAEHEGLL